MSQSSLPPTLEIDHEKLERIEKMVKKLHRYERICEKGYQKFKFKEKYRVREIRKRFLAYEARKRAEKGCIEDGKIIEENIEEVAVEAFETFMDLKKSTNAGEEMGELVITMPSDYYLLTAMEIVRGVKPEPCKKPFFCDGYMTLPKIKRKKKYQSYHSNPQRQKKRVRYTPIKK